MSKTKTCQNYERYSKQCNPQYVYNVLNAFITGTTNKYEKRRIYLKIGTEMLESAKAILMRMILQIKLDDKLKAVVKDVEVPQVDQIHILLEQAEFQVSKCRGNYKGKTRINQICIHSVQDCISDENDNDEFDQDKYFSDIGNMCTGTW